MNWKKLLLNVAKGIAKAVSLGLIGRGKKTQQAGELADAALGNLKTAPKKKGVKGGLSK